MAAPPRETKHTRALQVREPKRAEVVVKANGSHDQVSNYRPSASGERWSVGMQELERHGDEWLSFDKTRKNSTEPA